MASRAPSTPQIPVVPGEILGTVVANRPTQRDALRCAVAIAMEHPDWTGVKVQDGMKRWESRGGRWVISVGLGRDR